MDEDYSAGSEMQ